jgi:hypothetical protein
MLSLVVTQLGIIMSTDQPRLDTEPTASPALDTDSGGALATAKPRAHRARDRQRWLRLTAWAVAAAALVLSALAIYWSRPPALIDLRAYTLQLTGMNATELPPGAATTAAVTAVANALLNKPGGYLRNDVAPPSVLLDNMPNWEFGVLTELRDVSRALRNDFSRAQTQSGEDRDLMQADAQFHFDAEHWVLPAAENEYAAGLAALRRYLDRLIAGNASFYSRADNLNFYLATVEKRLGNFSQRLSESVREPMLRELIFENESQAPAASNRTPWLEIDDVFFEARGYIWALVHVLRGIEMDFQAVLEQKNAAIKLRRIIDKLENTQQTLWSPMIFNSTGFGMLTNHSLVMASYISRANAAVIDLRRLLAEG